MKFQINDILKATNGKLIKGNDLTSFYSVSTDSRTISQDNVFIPLTGESFNGHDFLESVVNKGCNTYLISKKHADKIINSPKVENIIEVEDTLIAYLQIAQYYKNKINPKVIAITGSSGKTTTKEFVYSVISGYYKTHKTALNHNNEIGLCQTLLTMPENTEVLIVEMGMRGLGEIELLSKYAEPDVAIITNIGTAHIGRLGSIENIAKAKCEITNHLKNDGLLISHKNDLVKKCAGWSGRTIFYDINNAQIKSHTSEKIGFIYKNQLFELNVSGEHNVLNAIAAIEAGKELNIPDEIIAKGLKNYEQLENRGGTTTLKNNITIINDCYNANPDSVKASINNVLSAYPTSKISLVLGDMGELGEFEEKLHEEIGLFINNKNIYELLTIGSKAKMIATGVTNPNIKIKSFNKKEEIVKYFYDNLKENMVILIKASRSMQLETLVEDVKQVFK